ncbi:MAG: helicase, partial [Treponema sp.]|nr:helicase [Treponema sp.]
MQRDIAEAGGNEVFWIGSINADFRVISIKTGSRGNSGMVLVNDNLARREIDEDQTGAGHVVIHNHPSGKLEPSNADLDVAGRYMEMGIGSYIVDNQVSDVYVIVEPVQPKVLSPLDDSEAAFY